MNKFRALAVALATLMIASLGWTPPSSAAPSVALRTSAGEAIVGFTEGHMPSIAPGARLAGMRVTLVSPQGRFVAVKATTVTAARDAVDSLRGVAYVEDNAIMKALVVPNDTRYSSQYGPGMMGFPTAWGSAGYGSSAIKVSVIDSGIRSTHEDFVGGRVLAGHDYINNDGVPNDDCGHGTHTAGTVGATTNNAKGVAGMSQATIIPMKALSAVGGLLNVQCTGNHAQISQAIIDSADQGARVISMSIGGGTSSTLQNAVNYADGKGAILVAAAGNDGGSNSIDYPGAYPNVIAVGALTSSKTKASYSDGGPQLDIAAPGSAVLSTFNSNDASYSSLDGTSMATPHVAGALALTLGCAPGGTTKTQVVNALYSTAEDLGAAGWDSSYGNGLARVDRLVSTICGGTAPANNPPTAAFTHSTSGLTLTVNGSTSSDPDGDALTYAWTFGDGATATGVSATRTYAAAGTYTVGLTVNDGRGGTNSTTKSITVTTSGSGGDPDPSTPTLTSGQSKSIAISATNADVYYKIAVPAGATQLKVDLTGPACSVLSCSLDTDLYTRQTSRPTDTVYACRPYTQGNNETCTHASPGSGYWYLRVKRYSGSGTVNLKATVS
ncbi:MAG TPA: S8 family serine peptidase [Acidimicrobiales bacterium]|nr:S8 family serine peptidase [Acidimicrobiales bacterium]